MRHFNLEEYLANPTRKVVTREGKEEQRRKWTEAAKKRRELLANSSK